MNKMNKKAAIEMSMNTFVTIVLVVIVLVLAIFFIQKIFQSGSNAIDSIDSQVQNEINKLFADEGVKLSIYPSRMLTIKRGDDPKGFAFSVKNDINFVRNFQYSIEVSDFSNCGGSMDKTTANSYLITKAGQFSLGASASNDLARIVLFKVPKSAPACTLTYYLDIKREKTETNSYEAYTNSDIVVTLK